MAAEVDAKRKLAEWIAGAELESVTIVAEGTVITDTIRVTLKAKLPPRTTIVAQRYDAVAGVARVTVEMVLSK